MLNTISQFENANPESQMPVGLQYLRPVRPSLSLGLVKLSSKSNNQIQQLDM